MVEMTSDLDYTIREKVDAINRTLAHQDDGLPPQAPSSRMQTRPCITRRTTEGPGAVSIKNDPCLFPDRMVFYCEPG